jgi:hypothetical protein
MASCAIIAWGDRFCYEPGPVSSAFLSAAAAEAVYLFVFVYTIVCLIVCLLDWFVCLIV